jgi:geranylgeranyl diphosphate synthase type I
MPERSVANELARLRKMMLPAVEAEMHAVLRSGDQAGDPFLGMLHYHMGWADQAFTLVPAGGGKRIRPLLCLLACQSAGGDWNQAVPAAAALELLHNFSLIHDDIQDASPTRHGRSTLWQLWGASQAINSGDALYALAHLALNRLTDRGVDAGTALQAQRRLDETCLELTRGQYSDMHFESNSRVTVEQYLAMIEGKTAALLALAAELGALVAGRPGDVVAAYSGFGRNLGLAFQVRDDILGIWGEEALIGKSAATDIATRKKSLPVLYGLAQSASLQELYAASPASGLVEDVVAILDDLDARSVAEDYEARFVADAVAALEAARPEGPAATALRELAEQLLGRRS